MPMTQPCRTPALAMLIFMAHWGFFKTFCSGGTLETSVTQGPTYQCVHRPTSKCVHKDPSLSVY